MANPHPQPEPFSCSREHDEVRFLDGAGRVVQRRFPARHTAADFESLRDRTERVKQAEEARRRRLAAAFEQGYRDCAAAMERAEQTLATACSVKVGKPCPAEIVLDQGEQRCPAVVMVKYLCSRPTDHDGNHIATDGDRPGAEVLAVGSP